jgi:hypothetical protein
MRQAATASKGSGEQKTTRKTLPTPKALPGRTKTFSSFKSLEENSISSFRFSTLQSISTIAYIAPCGAMTLRPLQLESRSQRKIACRPSVSRRSLLHSLTVPEGVKRVGMTVCAKWEAPRMTCAKRFVPSSTSRNEPCTLQGQIRVSEEIGNTR